VIDGQSFSIELLEREGARSCVDVLVNGKRYQVERVAAESRVAEPAPLGASPITARAVRAAPGEVRAPMAGRVIHLHSRPGDAVAAGAPLMVLDAMKMENIIHAPRAGRVREVAIGVGETVLQGALLLRLE
jgi:biotin carboxyl carrier protein